MPKLTDTVFIEDNRRKRSKSKKRSASQRSANLDLKDPKRINQNVSLRQTEDRVLPVAPQAGTIKTGAMTDEAAIEIATRVGDCVTAQSENVVTLNAHSDRIVENDKEIKALQLKNEKLTKRLDIMDAAIKAAIERIDSVEKTANANQHALKNCNIVVEGIPEVIGENCMEKVCSVFKEIEDKCQIEDIISAYRVGQKSTDAKYTRPIVVKLMDPLVKTVIMEGKWKLIKHEQFGRVFQNDDLPPKIKKERKVLREICKYANSIGYHGCKVSGSKFVINGKAYRFDTIHLLPEDLQLCNIRQRRVGRGIGFQSEEAFLSNFFPATLTMEQLSFSSAEQAYQYFKARTCANKILTLSNPRDIKLTGDEVPTTAVWEQNKEAFMRAVVFSKFRQNDDLRKKLLDTGDLPLYECTKNRWWGSGLHLDSPEWETGNYPGLNKLGGILAEVCRALKKATYQADASLRSPTTIIKKIAMIDREIQEQAGAGTIPVKRYKLEDGNSDPSTSSQIGGEIMLQSEPMDDQSAVSSVSDDEDLMGQTDLDEESVNISAHSQASTLGTGAKTSILDVTDAHGNLDLSKIRKWTIPKLKESSKQLVETSISEGTRNQKLRNTLPLRSTADLSNPQAQSTPQVKKPNRSMTLQRVRARLGTRARTTKEKEKEVNIE